MFNRLKISICIAALIALSGCATATKDNPDPYEGYNRAIYSFNGYAYDYAVGPVADAYTFVLPTMFQHGVSNFFNNTFEISHVVNDLLQFEFANAGKDATRFVLNTIFGVVGLFDVATTIGLEPRQQNFGLTMAKWGWEDSAYFVLPLAGPSTVRDTLGVIPDAFMNPLLYASTSIFLPGYNGGLISDGVSWGIFGVYAVSQASIFLPQMEGLTEYAIDPYIAVRNAYLQYKDAQLHKLKDDKLVYQPN